jgi:hypothetical protein
MEGTVAEREMMQLSKGGVVEPGTKLKTDNIPGVGAWSTLSRVRKPDK